MKKVLGYFLVIFSVGALLTLLVLNVGFIKVSVGYVVASIAITAMLWVGVALIYSDGD